MAFSSAGSSPKDRPWSVHLRPARPNRSRAPRDPPPAAAWPPVHEAGPPRRSAGVPSRPWPLRAPGPPPRAPDRAGIRAPAAFRPHQMARLLQLGPRPVVIGCALQGGGGGVTQRLHSGRPAERRGSPAPVAHAPRAIRAKRSASFASSIGCSCRISRNRATTSTGKRLSAGNDRVQPGKQHRAIAGRGRCGKLHQLRDLLGRQAADDANRAALHIAARYRRAVGQLVAQHLYGDAATAVASKETRVARRKPMPSVR